MPCTTDPCALCHDVLDTPRGHFEDTCPYRDRYELADATGQVTSMDEFFRVVVQNDPVWIKARDANLKRYKERQLKTWTGALSIPALNCVDLHGVVNGQMWCWRLTLDEIDRLVAKHGKPQEEQP